MRDLTFSTDTGLRFGPSAPPGFGDHGRTRTGGLGPPTWSPERCAAGQHAEVGCRRCVDACPYEAIKVLAGPGGAVVHVVADACAQCGTCTGVCPTSALTRAIAPDHAIHARVADALAASPGATVVFTCSDGTPRVPPAAVAIELPSVTIVNETHALQAARNGARQVVVLGCPRCHHGTASVVGAALAVATQLDPGTRFAYVEDDGSDLVLEIPDSPRGHAGTPPPPLRGTRPEIGALLLGESRARLPAGTIVGQSGFLATVSVDDDACTLCGACARTCPTQALTYDRASGTLSFSSSDCVRCGLCLQACRERALTLSPGVSIDPVSLERRTLIHDDTIPCAGCGEAYLPARLMARVRDAVARTTARGPSASAEVDLCPTCRSAHLDEAPRRAAPRDDGRRLAPSPSPNRPTAPEPIVPPAATGGGDRRSFLRLAATGVAAAAGAMLTQRANAQLRAPAARRTKRMGMVIDLERCTGCHACTAVCKAENDVPLSIYRDWVEEHVLGSYPHARPYFLPKLCNHCDDPGCLRACPTGAIFMRTDGIVDIDHDRCIACRACNQGCPYGVTFMDPVRATADKCTFCTHRVDQGLNPACVDICPSRCRIFGDLDDPDSAPSIALRGQNHQVLRRELGLGPNVRYLGLPAELDR